MAGTTIIIRQNVANFFTRSQYAVVTELAIIHDTHMCKRCWQEARGLVTHTTIFIGWNMSTGFTQGGNTIVTYSAAVDDACMIKSRPSKCRCVVTHRTIFSRG